MEDTSINIPKARIVIVPQERTPDNDKFLEYVDRLSSMVKDSEDETDIKLRQMLESAWETYSKCSTRKARRAYVRRIGGTLRKIAKLVEARAETMKQEKP